MFVPAARGALPVPLARVRGSGCGLYVPIVRVGAGGRSSSEIRFSGQVTFQKRTADGVRGGAPREIFALFASK